MNENIEAGANIHAGDGGYSLGTQEKYDEFVKGRNQSLGKMRIKKLAEQATIWQGMEDGYIFDKEKFAELLVRECAQVADMNAIEAMGLYGKVLEHFGFGVEE
jgi:hypothetical protein